MPNYSRPQPSNRWARSFASPRGGVTNPRIPKPMNPTVGVVNPPRMIQKPPTYLPTGRSYTGNVSPPPTGASRAVTTSRNGDVITSRVSGRTPRSGAVNPAARRPRPMSPSPPVRARIPKPSNRPAPMAATKPSNYPAPMASTKPSNYPAPMAATPPAKRRVRPAYTRRKPSNYS